MPEAIPAMGTLAKEVKAAHWPSPRLQDQEVEEAAGSMGLSPLCPCSMGRELPGDPCCSHVLQEGKPDGRMPSPTVSLLLS